MKKIISASIFGLGLLASQNSTAATSPVLTQTGFTASNSISAGWFGDTNNDANLFEYFRFSKAVSNVTHEYNFMIDSAVNLTSEVTLTLKNLVTVANVFIDDKKIDPVVAQNGRYYSTFGLLAGSHKLILEGIKAAKGGHYDITLKATTAATPVPAAVWLFGSGLAGLVASRRQKPQLAV